MIIDLKNLTIKYVIPAWCKMPKSYHHDGMGGCWGISRGFVEKEGEAYCLGKVVICEYWKEVIK